MIGKDMVEWFISSPVFFKRKVVIQHQRDGSVIVELLQYDGVPRDWRRVGQGAGSTIAHATFSAFRALKEAKGNG